MTCSFSLLFSLVFLVSSQMKIRISVSDFACVITEMEQKVAANKGNVIAFCFYQLFMIFIYINALCTMFFVRFCVVSFSVL